MGCEMIVTAFFIVWPLEALCLAPPPPMHYREHWMSDSFATALVELIAVQAGIEREENWMVWCYDLKLEERPDIGY